MQTPSHPPPKFWSHCHERCAMCWNEWKIHFPFFSFSELSWKFIENWGHLSTKMTITRKIKIWNLIFLSIQPIPLLSCKFKHFWKEKIWIFMFFKYVRTFLKKKIQIFYFFGGAFAPYQKTSRIWEFYFRIGGP